jgi:hypothetical protein
MVPYTDPPQYIAACSKKLDYHQAPDNTVYSVLGGGAWHNANWWKWCWDAMTTDETLTKKCQAAFGSKASVTHSRRCEWDDACATDGVGRAICNVPEFYTDPGVNPNDGAYAACNLGGPEVDFRKTTLLPPGFYPVA